MSTNKVQLIKTKKPVPLVLEGWAVTQNSILEFDY